MLVAVFLLLPGVTQAQTCSCAGAPLISAQSAGAKQAGQLVIGLTFEHHEISRVFAGTDRVGEETERYTRSTLLEAHYGVTDRLGLSGTLGFTQKDRTTGTDGSSAGSTVRTNGIGDALVMGSYTVLKQDLFHRHHLSVSAGLKAPLGSSSLSQNGHPLNADMQPGTGSWDGLFSAFYSMSLLPASTAAVFAAAAYRHSGTNERFNAQDRYRFGNETTVSAGAGKSIWTDWAWSVSMMYRTTRQDQRNDADIFNTGGRWLYVLPSLQWSAGRAFDVRVFGRYPVAQWLRGTQPSTSFAAGISLFYSIGQKDNGFSTTF